MPDVPDLTKLECVSRKVQTTSSGMRIERVFYFEPYDAFPTLLERLQGRVAKQPAGNWMRIRPARDPYIIDANGQRNCYCSECHLTLPGGDKALTTSESMQWKINEQGVKEGRSLTSMLEDVKEKPITGGVGGHVKAIYRPLLSAAPDSDQAFDFINPTFSPSFKQMPWPEGLQTKTRGVGVSLPKDLAEPLSVPVTEFSVRRMLVGDPHHRTIESLAGCLNDAEFPPQGHPAYGHVPRMHRGTLKFEGAEIINRMDAASNRWYEVTYRFSRIILYDDVVLDEDGNEGSGWVTWNHVFMKPWWWTQVLPRPTGWYFVHRRDALQLGPIAIDPFIPFPMVGGSAYKYGDFTKLFLLNWGG